MSQPIDLHEVVITGYGLVTPQGVESSQIWDALSSPQLQNNADTTRFSPYLAHTVPPYDASSIITTRSHLRGMGEFQVNAAYAAGVALRSAGVHTDAALREKMALIVACNDGQRDVEIDEQILSADVAPEAFDDMLNRRLSSLRPTLFLCQLPNLFSANISMAHGVTGSSVTFMGDQHAGVSAVATAMRKIQSGQENFMLVGGGFGLHYHKMLSYAATGCLHQAPYKSAWQRENGFLVFGNAAAFLVLESKAHALARQASIKAKLAHLSVSYKPRSIDNPLAHTQQQLNQSLPLLSNERLVLTDCAAPASVMQNEATLWQQHGFTARNTTSLFGTLMEASLPVNLAIATLCMEKGQFLAPMDAHEQALPVAVSQRAIQQILVNCRGVDRGEAQAIIEAAA